MRVVDAIAQELYESGVRYAFGIPGGEVLHIVEALRKVGIEFILTRHEMGAGFMADAVSRLSDGPSVLVATLGPGMTNTVTPVAQAYLDRSPLVVITGAVATNIENIYTHQIINQEAVLKPITKYSATIRSTDAGDVTAKAIKIACNGRPGPVHLNLPTDVAGLECNQSQKPLVQATSSTIQFSKQPDKVREALANCKRPIALVGLGVKNEETSHSVEKFIEQWRIPVLTTYKAKGVVAESTLFSLGAIGLSPVIDKIQQELLGAADLIIAIGFDPVELRSDWLQVLQETGVAINVDVVEASHEIYRSTHELIGEIAGLLDNLAPSTVNPASIERWPESELVAHRKRLREVVEVPRSTAEGLQPYEVLKVLREELSEDAIACVDTGAHRILANHVWECFQPNGLLQSNGLGSMGYALPAAIGAQLLHPDRTVLCLTGDAGFDMITGEMALLAQHNLTPIIVVFADRALSLIKLKQQRMQLPTYGVDFDIPNYSMLATAYGGQGYTVDTAEALRNLLQDLNTQRKMNTFVLIQANIVPQDYASQM